MSDLGNRRVFAENLQSLISSRGISRRKVSDDLNIPYSSISSWLQADAYPRIDKIELLSKYFNVSKSRLVESNKQSTSTSTVDEALDNLVAFNGKPVSDHDRAVLKGLIESYLSSRD